MRKRNLFILIVSAIVSCNIFTSCNNSFLDEAPKNELSDVSFWKTEDDVYKYTVGLYRYTLAPENHIIMTDCYTDNAVPVHVTAAQGELSSGTATSTNAYFQQVWKQAFQGIRRCNIFFENIDNVAIDQDTKDLYKGEVYFLRGFFYATLLRLYGGVPILETTLSLSDPIPARNSVEEVYEFIIDDLEKAESLLPEKQKEVGRVTKGAAIAEQAIISNFLNKYEEAATYAKEVISLDIYDLYPNYGNLFLPDYENNEEVIFDRQYMENAKDKSLGSDIDQYFAPQMMGGWEAISPTKDLIDTYECIDGKPISESDLYNEDTPFENRDPRLKYSILYDGSVIAGKVFSSEGRVGDGNSTRTGYSIRKYINPANDGMNYPGWTNFIYIRYAEILLVYAEALNEISGPSDEVYWAVNKVRSRVNMPALPENLSKDVMREAIRKEKRVELTFEGVYFYDIRHWRTAEAALEKPVYGKKINGEYLWVENRKFNPNRDYLWAIPLTELDLSKGSLEQNPGW